jgi:hypothetical protein
MTVRGLSEVCWSGVEGTGKGIDAEVGGRGGDRLGQGLWKGRGVCVDYGVVVGGVGNGNNGKWGEEVGTTGSGEVCGGVER